MIPLPPIFRAFALAAGLLFPAVAPGSVTIDAPLFAAPPMLADPGTPTYVTDPTCSEWCYWRHVGLDAYRAGDYQTAVTAAFLSYGIPEWANWGWATINCESGADPAASSGWYLGWAQMDPVLWPGRAAAAGLPGADVFNGFENASVMAWMISSGYQWDNWPVCGRNQWLP